jgi:hypothetical protein
MDAKNAAPRFRKTEELYAPRCTKAKMLMMLQTDARRSATEKWNRSTGQHCSQQGPLRECRELEFDVNLYNLQSVFNRPVVRN